MIEAPTETPLPGSDRSLPTCPVIGHYREQLTGGPEPTLFGEHAFYASRWQWLPGPKAWYFQVLTMVLWELAWLNIDQNDIIRKAS